MKRLYRVGKQFFEKKKDAKFERNKQENYTPTKEKDGTIKPHTWKTTVKRGPDHWRGATK